MLLISKNPFWVGNGHRFQVPWIISTEKDFFTTINKLYISNVGKRKNNKKELQEKFKSASPLFIINTKGKHNTEMKELFLIRKIECATELFTYFKYSFKCFADIIQSVHDFLNVNVISTDRAYFSISISRVFSKMCVIRMIIIDCGFSNQHTRKKSQDCTPVFFIAY